MGQCFISGEDQTSHPKLFCISLDSLHLSPHIPILCRKQFSLKNNITLEKESTIIMLQLHRVKPSKLHLKAFGLYASFSVRTILSKWKCTWWHVYFHSTILQWHFPSSPLYPQSNLSFSCVLLSICGLQIPSFHVSLDNCVLNELHFCTFWRI